MNLTKTKLKEIIREEIENTLKELGPGYGGTNPEFTAAVARGEQQRCEELANEINNHIQDVKTGGLRAQEDGLPMAVDRFLKKHLSACPDLESRITERY